MLITLHGERVRQSLFQRLQDAGGLAAHVAPDAIDAVVCFGEGPVREDPPDLNAGQGWSQSKCLSDFKAYFQNSFAGTLIPVFHDPWAEPADVSAYPDRTRTSGLWFVQDGRPYRLPDVEDDFPIDKWFRGAVGWLNVIYFLQQGLLPAGIPAEEVHSSHEIASELARALGTRIAWVFVTAFDQESWLGAKLTMR